MVLPRYWECQCGYLVCRRLYYLMIPERSRPGEGRPGRAAGTLLWPVVTGCTVLLTSSRVSRSLQFNTRQEKQMPVLHFPRGGGLLRRINTTSITRTSTSSSSRLCRRIVLNRAYSNDRYSAVLDHIYRLNSTQTVKMGLGKIEALHDYFGRPLDRVPIIHVAGTNGKGSVCLKVARALSESGYRTGLFISPHLFSYRERAQVDGELIGAEETVALIEEILCAAKKIDVVPSFFEITTMLASLHFARTDVDCAVLETGLGGRLDCTNICKPVATCITSIGLDHTSVLGDNLVDIAREKAGIMKAGVPMILGSTFDEEVMELFRKRAKEIGRVSLRQAVSRNEATTTAANILGETSVRFDVENSATAREMLELLRTEKGFDKINEDSVRVGVAHRPPCRVQRVRAPVEGFTDKIDVVIDAAHNELGMRELRNGIQELAVQERKSVRYVLGISADKCASKALSALLGGGGDDLKVKYPRRTTLHFAQSQHNRASPASLLRSTATKYLDMSGRTDVVVAVEEEGTSDEEDCGTVHDVLSCALRQAASNDEILVVCGSLYMMEEVSRALDIGVKAVDPVFKGKRAEGAPTHSVSRHLAEAASM